MIIRASTFDILLEFFGAADETDEETKEGRLIDVQKIIDVQSMNSEDDDEFNTGVHNMTKGMHTRSNVF